MTSSRHFIYLIISFYIYLDILYIAGLQWFSNYGTQTIVVLGLPLVVYMET